MKSVSRRLRPCDVINIAWQPVSELSQLQDSSTTGTPNEPLSSAELNSATAPSTPSVQPAGSGSQKAVLERVRASAQMRASTRMQTSTRTQTSTQMQASTRMETSTRMQTFGDSSQPSTAPGVRPAKKLERIVSLDAWRGLALTIVLLCHCGAATAMVVHKHVWVADIFRKFATYGYFGLCFLFVLSGYLITRILLESRQQPHYYKNYYARRVLRIFPLYYGFLLLCLVVGPMVFGQKLWLGDVLNVHGNTFWMWVYGTNIYQTVTNNWQYGFISHLWSLSVEEHFYLIWPFIIAALPPIRIMQLGCLLIGSSTLLRVYSGFIAHDFFGTRVNTLCNMDCISAGAVIAVLLTLVTKADADRIGKALLWTAMALFPIYAFFSWHSLDVSGVFGPTLAGMGVSGLVMRTVAAPESCRLFAHNLFKQVGKYSYGMYMFHYPIIYYVARHYVPHSWPPLLIFAAVFALSMSVVAPLAVLSFRFYETPFLKLKEKFDYFKA